MNVLVTGGAGFIGSNTADALLAAGHRVIVVDNLSTGFKHNVPDQAEFYKMDIQDKKIGELLADEKIEQVVHLAAQIDVRKSVHEPVYDAQVNILGSINLIQAAAEHKISNFLFSSTGGAIYGEQDYFPADEEHPQRPVSPYGIGKLTIEHYLYYYHVQYGFNYFVNRYANVYGPRQNSKGEAGVVAIFIDRLLGGQQAVINGDGLQTRDYVFVGDVVRANLLGLQQTAPATVNIGTGIETDVNQIFREIRDRVNPEAPEVHGDAAPGEQRRSVIDNGRAQKLLGWKPEVSLSEGIARTVADFRSRKEQQQ